MQLPNLSEEIQDVIGILKECSYGKYSNGDRNHKIPKFNPVYEDTVKLKERIAVHSEFGKLPYDMIKKRGPFEDDAQYKYRVDNWSSVTMPDYNEGLSQLNRIMNASNYSINWKPDAQEFKEYFETKILSFRSIETFFEQIVLPTKINDPNALLVHKPLYLPTKEVVENGELAVKFDDTKLLEIMPVIVPCDKVVRWYEGLLAIIILPEKSLVKEGNKLVKEGVIFEIYDQNNIYRVEQTGKRYEFTFSDPYTYYSHNLGYLPCERLKGFPVQKDVYTYYQSYYINAIPSLDSALYLNSNIDMSTINHMHPQRVEVVSKCPEMHCIEGWVTEFIDDKESRRKCSVCNGSGTLSRVGPMMVKQHVLQTGISNDENPAAPFPGVAYVTPDPSGLDFAFKKYQHDIDRAFKFLQVNKSNSNVKGTETALGKQIDRDALFTFLMRISNELFDLLSFSYKCIGEMRWSKDKFQAPEVSPPTSFQIRSEFDLLEELTEAKKAGLPEIALREVIKQTMNKRFSSQEQLEKATNLIMAVDRFVTLNNIEIQSKVSAKLALPYEAVLHDSASAFIIDAVTQDDKFFAKDFTDQKNIIIEMAKLKATEIAAAQPQTGTVNSIVSAANE